MMPENSLPLVENNFKLHLFGKCQQQCPMLAHLVLLAAVEANVQRLSTTRSRYSCTSATKGGFLPLRCIQSQAWGSNNKSLKVKFQVFKGTLVLLDGTRIITLACRVHNEQFSSLPSFHNLNYKNNEKLL